MSQNDNIAPFLIKIQSAFEKGGIEGAQKELDKLSKQSETTEKTTKSLTEQTSKAGSATFKTAGMIGQLARGLGASGGAAGKFSSAIGFAASAIQGLSGGINGLVTVMGAAALGVWLKYQKRVEEAKKKLEEFKTAHEQSVSAANNAKVDNLSKLYADLASAIDNATAKQDRLNQALAARDSAEKADKMAQITLSEKEELNKLKNDDTLGQAKVSSKYSTQRRNLESEYEQKDIERQVVSAERKLADNQEKISQANRVLQDTQSDIAAKAEEKAKLEAELGAIYTTNKPMKTIPGAMGPGGVPLSPDYQVVDKEEQAKQASFIKKQLYGYEDIKGHDDRPVAGRSGEYDKLIATMGDLRNTLEDLTAESTARTIETEAARTRRSTITTTNPRMNAADDYAEDRSVRDMESKQKVEEVKKQAHPELDKYLRLDKSADDATDRFNQGRRSQSKDATRYHKEAREMERAADKSAAEVFNLMKKSGLDQTETLKAIVDYMKQNNASNADIQQQVKEIQQRFRRAGSGG